MSYFTDFLIADPKEARKIARTANPTAQWPGVSWKSIGSLDMANLYANLKGRTGPQEVIALLREFKHLHLRPPEGPLVDLIPEELVILLSQLDEEGIDRAAAGWANAEEFRGCRKPSDLAELLKELRELAAQSRTGAKSLLICTTGV